MKLTAYSGTKVPASMWRKVLAGWLRFFADKLDPEPDVVRGDVTYREARR